MDQQKVDHVTQRQSESEAHSPLQRDGHHQRYQADCNRYPRYDNCHGLTSIFP
jgi:hypothetical protein